MTKISVIALTFCAVLPFIAAQQPVSPHNMYTRVVAVVPMIGAGTADDPRRPLYSPLPKPQGSKQVQDILGFTSQMSDDGKFALIELVGRNRAALTDILNDKRTDIKVFEKGKVRPEDIEAEFKKYKKDFDVKKAGGSRP